LKRNIIDLLIKWKTEDNTKPILISGLKGVGKTYLAYDFAKAFFECIYYINLEHESDYIKLFEEKNPALFKEALAARLQLDKNTPVEARILILDEIGCCSNALEIIKTCDISDIFRYIILISSKPVKQLPDNIKELKLYPLGFDEFLVATGNDWYIEAITTHFNSNKNIPEIVHKELLELNRIYLQTGGLPAAINEYLGMSSMVNVQEIHDVFCSLYRDYINRHNNDSDALKMLQVYDSLAYQLAKENKKFQYKLIRKGTTHTMYKDAIQRLLEYDLVIKCSRISSEQLLNPAETFRLDQLLDMDANAVFKLYYPDSGLLQTQMRKIYGSLDKTHQKAILENYLASSLAARGYSFAFWESEAMSRIDFIYMKEGEILPVELFEDENTRSKNISVLKQKCSFPYAVKISSKNFDFRNQVKFVPYYAVFCL